jgi:predicted amidohydrolase
MSEEDDPQRSIRVAAIQSQPQLGDVDANLENVRKLVRRAFSAGAQWVVLPEFFTTGIIFDDSLLAGHRPLDGAPMQLLKELAREGGATVGGSYLAESDRDVYNTFVLAHRDGKVYTHDKDFPSGPIEHAYYAGGEDAEFAATLRAYGVQVSGEPIPSRPANNQAGVFALPDFNVGAALCWEMIRRRTVTRMVGKVDMVLACSAWPSIEPEWGFPGMSHEQIVGLDANLLVMLQNAPNHLARMLGVPVVHANFVGTLQATQLFGQSVTFATRYCGESKVVDARGTTVACRPAAEGEGVVVADLSLERTLPEDTPGDAFWMAELTPVLKELWYNQGAVGREYYLRTARPFRTRGS